MEKKGGLFKRWPTCLLKHKSRYLKAISQCLGSALTPALDSSFLLGQTLQGSKDSSRNLVPAIHRGILDWIPSSQYQPDPAPANVRNVLTLWNVISSWEKVCLWVLYLGLFKLKKNGLSITTLPPCSSCGPVLWLCHPRPLSTAQAEQQSCRLQLLRKLHLWDYPDFHCPEIWFCIW